MPWSQHYRIRPGRAVRARKRALAHLRRPGSHSAKAGWTRAWPGSMNSVSAALFIPLVSLTRRIARKADGLRELCRAHGMPLSAPGNDLESVLVPETNTDTRESESVPDMETATEVDDERQHRSSIAPPLMKRITEVRATTSVLRPLGLLLTFYEQWRMGLVFHGRLVRDGDQNSPDHAVSCRQSDRVARNL